MEKFKKGATFKLAMNVKQRKKNALGWLERNYGYFFIAGFLVFLKTVYLWIQQVKPQGIALTTFLDTIIPFTSFFVLFYVLYYPFLTLPLFLTLREKDHFVRTLGAMTFVASVSFFMYLIFQTQIIRPNIIPNSFLDSIVLWIYSLDAPVNAFPSLHVSLTTIAFLSLRKKYNTASGVILLLAIGIIVSTLFIKQHYVADVVGGLVLAGLAYSMFFQYEAIKSRWNKWKGRFSKRPRPPLVRDQWNARSLRSLEPAPFESKNFPYNWR